MLPPLHNRPSGEPRSLEDLVLDGMNAIDEDCFGLYLSRPIIFPSARSMCSSDVSVHHAVQHEGRSAELDGRQIEDAFIEGVMTMVK